MINQIASIIITISVIALFIGVIIVGAFSKRGKNDITKNRI